MEKDIERILFTETEIRTGIGRIAQEVTKAYQGEHCTVVSVLKGGCLFTADLIRQLTFPLSLTFAAVSSYRDGTHSGTLSLDYFPPKNEVQGQRILLVDDILDTGRTLTFLQEELLTQGGARSQNLCAPRQACETSRSLSGRLLLLHYRRCLCRWLWARLRRTLPQCAVSWCAASRGLRIKRSV